MLGRGKAQVALETVVAASIVLILLIFVLFYNVVSSGISEIVGENYKDESKCAKISSIINNIAANPGGNEIYFELDENAVISNRTVYIGRTYCLLLGNVPDASLDIGTVRVYDINGVIFLENA